MNRDPHVRSQCTLAESLTSIVLPNQRPFCVADLGEFLKSGGATFYRFRLCFSVTEFLARYLVYYILRT